MMSPEVSSATLGTEAPDGVLCAEEACAQMEWSRSTPFPPLLPHSQSSLPF